MILTVEQFFLILPLIPQPYRMMTLLAQCSGLRVEEVLALEKAGHPFREAQYANRFEQSSMVG